MNSTAASDQPKISDLLKEKKKRSSGRTRKAKFQCLAEQEEELPAVSSPRKRSGKKSKQDGGDKKKRKVNRFDGMSEEEVAQRGLPDYLKEGLDVVFIGINPSLCAAYSGRYYDGPGNHFWSALTLSGMVATGHPLGPMDDHRILDCGIGFTNVVARTTRGIADLKTQEIREGSKILREKMAKFRPKVAVFNGKAIYQVYSGEKNFMFGKQPEPMDGTDGKTWVWVMPSSSARCAQLPRAVDKVPFFTALKKFVDFLKGVTDEPHEEEIVFAKVVLKNYPRKIKKELLDKDELQSRSEADSEAKEICQIKQEKTDTVEDQ